MIRGDKQKFRNEDLVLQVPEDAGRDWDEAKYEAYLDELCGFREYQKDAIRNVLRFVVGRPFNSLSELARANFDKNENLRERYGSWSSMQKSLQLPDKLACSVDLATGTGKSYVLFGIAAILLAEGIVDRVLVLCPSNTIEAGLLEKFRDLASSSDLRDLMPNGSKWGNPAIQTATETIVDGSICVENYHAILEQTGSSIRDSFVGRGERVAVLNDEAHHVTNDSAGVVKKWKEFLQDPKFGFQIVVGVSGTCYVNNDYFADVVYRFSLREAIEKRFVKTVEYVSELPAGVNEEEEKRQLVYQRHVDNRKKLKSRAIRPLTIIVTKSIADAEQESEALRAFLAKQEELSFDQASEKVLCVTSSSRHTRDVETLKLVDSPDSSVEWIVSVSMLSEGWDVKNVFQIVPHDERAFNSRLLIAQVLGRGLRRPLGWQGDDPVVTVFNHDSWSTKIKDLVDEILEIERRLTCVVVSDSPYHFTLHNLNYSREQDATTFAKSGEYRLFESGIVALPTQIETEEVTVGLQRAVTGEESRFKAEIKYATWSAEEVAEQMYQRLKAVDEESKEAEDPADRTQYAKRFPLKKCAEIVTASLAKAGIKSGRVTAENRQRFLQALGTLRRGAAKRVVYRLSPELLTEVETKSRPSDSCSASELRRLAKTVFVTGATKSLVPDDQQEFFDELMDEDGELAGSRVVVDRKADFKVPMSFVIAEARPERMFVRDLTKSENAREVDGWIKSVSSRFYWIEYAWRKGEHLKRGEFSPDFFLKQGDRISVVEIKGDEEVAEPSPENIKKREFAVEHFRKLNEWLGKSGSKIRYHLTFLSPKDFGKYFQKLRERDIEGFQSSLDIALVMAAKSV